MKHIRISDLILAVCVIFAASFIAAFFIPQLTEIADLLPSQLLEAAVDFLILFSGCIILVLRNPITWADIGLAGKKKRKAIAWGIICGLAIGIIQFPYKSISQNGKLRAEVLVDSGASSYLCVFLFLLIVIAATPLLEEAFYRFYMYWGVRNRFGRFWAYLVSVVLFSLGHTSIDSPQILLFIISAMALVYLYETTESLGSCIIAHMLWNAIWFGAAYSFS